MTPYNLSVLFFGYCTFFLSLLVYLKRQDAVGRYYFLFSCFVTLWALPFSVMISTNVSPNIALFACRLCDLSAVFIAVTWLHFTIVYAGDTVNRKWVLVFFYTCAWMIAMVSFSDLFVPKTQSVAGFRYYPYPGHAFHYFTVLFFTQVTMGFFYLKRKLDVSPIKEERIQVLGFMIATGTGFIGGGLTFLPIYGISLPQYNLFLMPFYPFLMAYFMMRRNLFSEENMVMAAHRDKLAAIGTLASSLNHEIKNPLYVIQGTGQSFLSGLREGVYADSVAVADQAAVVMERMTHQATRAIEIMRKFSTFAKRGIQESITVSSVNLREIYENILPLVQHELESQKISLIAEFPQLLPLVKADPRDLEEIFFNLIVNAAQAIKAKKPDVRSQHSEVIEKPENSKGQGFIHITAKTDKGVVHVTIHDNGPGIPKEDLKKIFEPFYTTKSEGTGLGLYITRQLVERNGGKISIQSKQGAGAEFQLSFVCA